MFALQVLYSLGRQAVNQRTEGQRRHSQQKHCGEAWTKHVLPFTQFSGQRQGDSLLHNNMTSKSRRSGESISPAITPLFPRCLR